MSYLGSKTCQTKATYIIMILTRISLFGLAWGWGGIMQSMDAL